MAVLTPVIAVMIYLIAGRLLIRQCGGLMRDLCFALLNLAGFYFFFVEDQKKRYAMAFVIYLLLVPIQYVVLRLFSGKKGSWPWLAFFTPIFTLIVLRYFPVSLCLNFLPGLGGWFENKADLTLASFFIGISYLAFRSSRLVLEVRNGQVKMPGFWEYIGFCFFLPTMPVGPINSFSNHHRAFGIDQPGIPVGRALLRGGVGYAKYKFLGTFFGQLGYSGLLLDDHPHPWMDLPVAMVFYYLFLYCNFSGFCDMAIGAAGVIGVPVSENFDNPFAARNVKDFWTRWHITLSIWMRDVVFSPLSKFFVGQFGIRMADHAIALTIVIVFLLVGIWHGVGWNFVAYGAVHALGVVTNHYYTIFLKKKLGREKFKAYNENRWIRAVAVVLTFCYCGASLIFFANSFPQIREIFHALH